VSHGRRKLNRLLNQNFSADLTFLYKSGFWQKVSMTSPEYLYTKKVVNEISFLLVTHMTCFDIRFDHYGFLKSGFNPDQVQDRLVTQVLDRLAGV
jgi:hypothetical protein